MPIKLDCPHCKNPLSVPKKFAGTETRCPRCQSEFRVPEPGEQPAELPRAPDVPTSSPAGYPPSLPVHRPPVESSIPRLPVTGSPAPRPEESPPTSLASSVPADASAGGPASAKEGPLPTASLTETESPQPTEPPPLLSPAQRAGEIQASTAKQSSDTPAVTPRLPTGPAPRVARLIAAKTVQSKLQLAEDGHLPDLQLLESKDAETTEKTSRKINPFVLVCLLCVSFSVTVLMLLVDPQNTGRQSKAKSLARKKLVDHYIHNLDDLKPLQPYQLDLRRALQAHSRGDFQNERLYFQRVLRMLRAEDRATNTDWLTGRRGGASHGEEDVGDLDLERQLTILLSDQ